MQYALIQRSIEIDTGGGLIPYDTGLGTRVQRTRLNLDDGGSMNEPSA